MALNGAKKSLIIKRREIVGRLRCRGLSIREIADAIAKEGEFTNLDTGKPFNHVTILNDLKAVEAEWREHAAQSIEEHKKRILAELSELYRTALDQKDLSNAVKAKAKESDILGLNAPVKIAGDVDNQLTIRIERVVTNEMSGTDKT